LLVIGKEVSAPDQIFIVAVLTNTLHIANPWI
jgi:hypothetical protein